MGSNRRWVSLAFWVAGLLLWVLATKFFATIMAWFGLEGFDVQLLGEQFTLTTMIGLVIALGTVVYSLRHARLVELAGEVIAELKKVTWPNAQETRGATVVVIITVFIMAVFLGLFDLFWSNLMDFLYPNVQV